MAKKGYPRRKWLTAVTLVTCLPFHSVVAQTKQKDEDLLRFSPVPHDSRDTVPVPAADKPGITRQDIYILTEIFDGKPNPHKVEALAKENAQNATPDARVTITDEAPAESKPLLSGNAAPPPAKPVSAQPENEPVAPAPAAPVEPTRPLAPPVTPAPSRVEPPVAKPAPITDTKMDTQGEPVDPKSNRASFAERGAAVSSPSASAYEAIQSASVASKLPSLSPLTPTASGFNDQAIPGGTSRQFLRQMVEKAIKHSPEVRSAEADALEAGYNVDQVKGQRWPQVQLGVSTPLGNFGKGRKIDNYSSPKDTRGSVSVTMPVFDWGKISASLKGAKEGVNSAEAATQLSREQIAYNTLSALLKMGRYLDERRVAKQYVNRMQELVNMLSEITKADRGRLSELVQAKAKLLSALTSYDKIENDLTSTRIRLVRLLGEEPRLPSNLVWDDINVPDKVALSSLANNPALAQMLAEVKEAEHEADAIRASNLPQVNLVVSKQTGKDEYGDEESWYTGVGVQWNAFSGGSARASHNAAVARVSAGKQRYETTYRDLEYQLRNLIQERSASQSHARDYDRLTVETDRVRKMFYDQWYHLGKRTLLDVLTAENDYFNNQIAALNTRYDAYEANANLLATSAMTLPWLSR